MKVLYTKSVFVVLFCCLTIAAAAIPPGSFVSPDPIEGFPVFADGRPAELIYCPHEHDGVKRAAGDLSRDVGRVTGSVPEIKETNSPGYRFPIIIGTIGHSGLMDMIFPDGIVGGEDLRGKTEKYVITTMKEPLPGVEQALIIAGSDKRGTIYGIYELSSSMGVSPWYWWADVPVARQGQLYVRPGVYTDGEPAVRYRGIFLNDEEPALGGWTRAKFGGWNSGFYEHVFELILRLKGNFLWPAMWNGAFFDDDPLNGSLADMYGIVIGTSHHEPMGRAHAEWKRYGEGPWDYTKNEKVLQEFWQGGMERMKDYETLVTIGMRGDGDEPMSEESNVKLLQKIVSDQRRIIGRATGKKPEQIPQVWALYKEVQDYYDKGMRVPDDVTLLLCDDNWGNVRRLPELDAKSRKGGYGMYYHFDYVGGPRNYKWINVSQIQRTWEQMNLTYRYGVDRIWVVNVGDLKPMEFPISFFLDMAWNPDRFDQNNLFDYTVDWCARQFGPEYAREAARLIDTYTKYNMRITPELLNETTYSLENYGEFERVVNDYKALALEALRIYYLMPEQYRNAFDELVLFPIDGMCNLYEMYYAVAKNRQLAGQNDERANYWADVAEHHFNRDTLLTIHYNRDIAEGKWEHMMDQVRIGYKIWQQPAQSQMPEVYRIPVKSRNRNENIFRDKDGYISVEAPNFTSSSSEENGIHWVIIPNLGRTTDGLTTMPVTASEEQMQEGVYVDYGLFFENTGEFDVTLLLSTTLDFNGGSGLSYSISMDDYPRETVNFNKQIPLRVWEYWLSKRIIESPSKITVGEPGLHTLRIYFHNPGIVLQKILIDTGGLKPCFLGPEQSPLYTN